MLPYFECFGVVFFTFPLVLTIGLLLCVVVYFFRKIYSKSEFLIYAKMILLIMPSAIVGGKILSIVSLILQNKGTIWECMEKSGTVFYGGLIGGVIALFFFARHYKLQQLDIFDVCASLLPLGQSVGRIGCYLNGCCYGCYYEGIGSVIYPIDGQMTYVFPTWFCESAFCFLLFVILQIIVNKTSVGITTVTYLISYSFFRFVIEFFRGDTIRGIWFGISTSQILSLIIIIFAIILLRKKPRRNKNLLLSEVFK